MNETEALLLQTPYEKRLAIIAETFLQLKKDIGIDDDLLVFEGNPESAYQQLLEYLEPYLFDMIQHNPQRFARVIYKVDISENALNKKLRYSSNKSYVRVVTEMIIYRAFQKVMTKMISRDNLKNNK
ncbi:MAG: hypothetical protein IT238_08500 [Bacteroidia bacterium]|nr:hypothetical protein [Bacteroidia bacterium]MCZ2248630.1 hypothetical protein [Bacteroidia bacterium]